jgi:Ca-activated chloride channel family protein
VIDVETNARPWEPSAVVHRDPGQDGYLVLQMAAPATVEQADVSGKDVTVVIDRSGSMSGAPLEQACAGAELVVRRLRRGDRVNVIAFDHAVDPLFAAPQPVASARDGALQFIRRIRAGGGTNIAAALEAALRAQNGGHEPHIVLFLTDGQSDSEAALRVAAADRGDVASSRSGWARECRRRCSRGSRRRSAAASPTSRAPRRSSCASGGSSIKSNRPRSSA